MARGRVEIAVKLTGAAEVRRKLRRLRGSAQKRILSRAIKLATTPVARAMRAEAPVDRRRKKETKAKSLRRRVKVAKVKRLRAGEIASYLARAAAPHSHLVEYGTAARTTKGAFRGSMPANPFGARAFEKTKGRALATIEREILSGIEKELAK